MQGPRNPEALRQAPPVGLRHVQLATWQHRVSAWAGSKSVCGQVRTRLGPDTCRYRTPPESCSRPGCILSCDLGTPLWAARTPYGGTGGGGEVRTVYLGVRRSPVGSGLTVDALEHATSSGHVAASDPPMWWSRALLWTQNSRLRLGRARAWSHTQHFYHATKGRTYPVQSLILVQACNQTIQSIQSRSNGFIWKGLKVK
jgi:hypothetical protein